MKWISKERPKIDRIACPWLILKYIDPQAEFLYVPEGEVLRIAAETGATPYDTKGTALYHQGELCTFDVLMRKHRLSDPALDKLARIVRGADTNRMDLAPECAGLYAISVGLGLACADDHEVLRRGLTLYDALHAWCEQQVKRQGA